MKKLFTLLLLCSLFSFSDVKASHIIGGYLSITHISGMDYELKCVIWRDCINGIPALPDPAVIEQHENTGSYTFIQSFNLPMIEDNFVTLGDECYTPTGLCVEEGVYRMTVTLTANVNGYYFAWSDCCRNSIIDNLNSPSSEGMTFVLEVPDPALGNSSPDFGLYPSTGYFCANNLNTIDESLVDPDGDSLVYSLSEPLSDDAIKPFTNVAWAGGYSLANIVGGAPAMEIDPVTGILTCSPTIVGNVYVFAIKVEEYRAGVKIGEIRRDLQYMALNCTFDQAPTILGLTDTLYSAELGYEFCFDLIVQDQDPTDTISVSLQSSSTFDLGAILSYPTPVQVTPDTLYNYYYTVPSTGLIDSVTLPPNMYDSTYDMYSNIGTVGLHYCWQTDCGNELATAPYEINILGFSLGCSGFSDTIVKTLYLNVLPITKGYQYTPNVFSPNGDQINDEFRIVGKEDPCYDFINVQIYNRWGKQIFESDDPLFIWDGKDKNGKLVDEGTYFLMVKGQYGGNPVDENFPVTVLY